MSLRQLQNDLAARLESCPYFVDVPVFVMRESTVQGAINQALSVVTPKANKIGVACSVIMPVLDVQNPNLPGPQGDLTVTVRCQEHPVFNAGENGTGKDAETIALEVAAALHHHRLGGTAGLLTADRNAILAVPNAKPGVVTYDVTIRCHLAIAVKATVAAVTITQTGDQVTLATATSGATIYYTIDGTSYPSAAAGASAYSGAITLAEGETTLRAAAELADTLPSAVTQETLTYVRDYALLMSGGYDLLMSGGRDLLMHN